MMFLIGVATVIICVIGGFLAQGGHLIVLFQPFEFVIIFGAAVGAFVISNPMPVIKRTIGSLGLLLKGSPYSKESYLELLSLLYTVFKLAKTKGMLTLEQHVEKPDESTLWTKFPIFAGDHYAMTFFCDYLRLLTLGTDNAHELEALIDEEIESIRWARSPSRPKCWAT
jgi:chemotaxis protein MotA